jgi:signal-transduction protein with cAMP-binding, CBS, and nucleotidyltransferase domain
MRARIDDVMRKQFSTVQADVELRTILQKFEPQNVELLPVVEKDGTLLGIIEPRDLLRADTRDHRFTMRELAHQDYIRAYPGDLVDRVNREMLLKGVENVVIVESRQSHKPIGIVRANDILQLRRWLVEEESVETKLPNPNAPGAEPKP